MIQQEGCAYCNKPLSGLKRRFCSGEHSRAFQQERTLPMRTWESYISPASVGAASELFASAFFLRKGYEVYRAVSPSSSCDLVLHKDGLMYRVEIRTINPTAVLKLPLKKIDQGRFDILAIVSKDSVVCIDVKDIDWDSLTLKKVDVDAN